MTFTFYKYQGTGNDFIILDNRNKAIQFSESTIAHLCDRRFGIGADGFMLLENDNSSDFFMKYYNSDGSESTMCGNGGRCLVQFAHDINAIKPETTFNAVDGLHHAHVMDEVVSLQMIDVNKPKMYDENNFFVNTGSPHHIVFVSDVDAVDVYTEGNRIRNSALYGKEGANVNFVEIINENTLKVRTYERGVEDETYSCGTGVTAAAIIFNYAKSKEADVLSIHTKGGDLQVSFTVASDQYSTVRLIGPATFVFTGTLDTDDFKGI